MSLVAAPSVPTGWLARLWAGLGLVQPLRMARIDSQAEPDRAEAIRVDQVISDLFAAHSADLVRMARLFVDDRNAAEDLVQEAFIRLSRSLGRLESPDKAAPYLRSIVLNLARDHNRRGLMSLRHQQSTDYRRDLASAEDEVVRSADQQAVADELRGLPPRQRDAVTLRYYLDLPIAEIAETLGVSPNSVKTHLRRGLAALEDRLESTR